MIRQMLSFAMIAAMAVTVLSQATDKKDPAKEKEKLRTEAVAFLRETMADVANLRTLENRISFSAEMAGLMWFHDEREARSMFSTAIGEFRELIARLDQQLAMLPESDGQPYRRGGLGDVSARALTEQKYRIAMAVRQQIASSIAEHDPDLALSFFYDSASSDPEMARADTYFEFSLMGQIAEKNAAKAAQFGIRSLASGLQYQHVDLLRRIYNKDQDKGVEFGSAILSKAKSGKPNPGELFIYSSLLNYGTQNFEAVQIASGKKAIFSNSDLRDLAEVLANTVLSGGIADGMVEQYASQIERYHPGRAAQIRAKFRQAGTRNGGAFTLRGSAANTSAAPPPDYAGPVSTSGSGSNANSYEGGQDENGQQQAEQKLLEDVGRIGKGELPKEEREKVVSEARKILMQGEARDRQITGLSMLAAQVSRAGDRELAAQIMRDAESLVNPNPKNYQDFIFTWMLAAGYAESDPSRSFPILEDAIGRANDLIAAFVRVGEFIDVSEEMISDGEVQVGAFGGGMIRGLSKELGVAESTLATLTKADFAKTKALTNRFDRPEVRVLAKMLVLRSVLGKKAATPTAEEQVEKVMGQN